MVVRPLEDGWRHPEEAFCLRRRRDRGGVVVGEDARLQLADPVQAGGDRTARSPRDAARTAPRRTRVAKQPNAGVRPRSVRINWSCAVMSSTTRPNRAWRAKSSPFSASRCTSASGSPLARRNVRRLLRLIARVCEVAGLLRRVERVPRERAALRTCRVRGLGKIARRPGRREPSSGRFHAAPPGQARARRSGTRPVVAEVRPQDVAHRGVGVARCVAVAVLQAEVPHAADDKADAGSRRCTRPASRAR